MKTLVIVMLYDNFKKNLKSEFGIENNWKVHIHSNLFLIKFNMFSTVLKLMELTNGFISPLHLIGTLHLF